MNTDAELLRRFVEDGSETAFTELVHRYLSLVRVTAMRRVGGDAHAADDITQQVFVSLARKASSLRGRATLAGWLYISTHHATAGLVRREQRRKQREATAHSMQLTNSSVESSTDAARLRPLLDDALITLKPDEREAIVLRFFSERTFSQIGMAVQLSEEAARKRVDRALEKLHSVLTRRGVNSTIAALGATLTAVGLESVPAGLAVKVAGNALAQAAVPGVIATLAPMLWPAAAASVVVAGMLAIASQQRANTSTTADAVLRETDLRAAVLALEDENQRLARDLAYVKRVTTDQEKAVPASTTRIGTAQPVAPRVVSPAKSVFVSKEGTLTWEGDRVTLDQFLLNLASLQSSAPNGKSRLVVKAVGARFHQLNYVLDEARKAGITNLVIESDAQPIGPMNTWF